MQISERALAVRHTALSCRVEYKPILIRALNLNIQNCNSASFYFLYRGYDIWFVILR